MIERKNEEICQAGSPEMLAVGNDKSGAVAKLRIAPAIRLYTTPN